ncbi:MAG: tRNA pseudouridine(55) synthase TruB [Candidatus Hydrogenedentes bacterium]|nr:tRNA pseudouridine(55) synthase TruB [Candidatus Hydrogenedentota bacterium]
MEHGLQSGILLVDKPTDWTSHDVVQYVRKKTGIAKVGHTGTLDPIATGLLILCIGKATRLSEFFMSMDKTYEGRMRLGLITDTHDILGKVLEERQVVDVNKSTLYQLTNQFIGEIEQVPPMVSALKVGGQRLYELARKGISVDRRPRKVRVYEFSILGLELPYIKVRISCGKGTYVRTLIHDFGLKLGCGAVMAELRRIKLGKFSVEDAIPVKEITDFDSVSERIIPIDSALSMPKVSVYPKGEEQFNQGRKVFPKDIKEFEGGTAEYVQVLNEMGKFLGIGTIKFTAIGPFVTPKKVLADTGL